MWPVLVVQFHVKVLVFHTGGDGSASLFQDPILPQFGHSFFPLKALFHTFLTHVLLF